MYEARQNKEKVPRQTEAGGGVRQRKKQQHILTSENILLKKMVLQCKILEDGSGQFYSDKDPNRCMFNSREEAEVYESYLSYLKKPRRPPTSYTFTHTPETRDINSLGIPQGPHTLAYAAVGKGLEHALSNQDPQTVLNEQCLPPEGWFDVVKELHPSLSDVVESRIQRAGKRHEALYEKAKESIVNNDMQQFHFYVSSMIQLDPRATYGWDTTQKASHAALKGKGENIDIEDDRNIDIGGLVRGSYDAEEFIYDRRLMMDGDYYEEDFEEDFEEDLEEDLDED